MRRKFRLIAFLFLLLAIMLSIIPHLRLNAEMTVASKFNSLEQYVIQLVNGTMAYNYDLELEKIAFKYYSFRSGGSFGANETAYWIKGIFESFGMESWLEPFEFITWNLLSKPTLILDEDGNLNTTYDQIPINSFQSTHLSWPTPENGVFADLVTLPLPEAANISEIGLRPINKTLWDSIDTTGKIILTGREIRWAYNWEQAFVEKISSQPPAAVIYTWWYDWMNFTPIMLSSSGGRPLSGFGAYYWSNHIPVGAVNYEDGLRIRNWESSVNVSAYVLIDSVIGNGLHYNVVGRILGCEEPEKVVIVSGHYDTVMCGGFCDNGAGVAGVIEIARVLSKAVREKLYRPKYTLLFIAFASEEFGLVGSINYVKAHKNEMQNIVAVINLDSIGSDQLCVTETSPANGFDLDEVIVDAAQDLGVSIIYEEPGGSDHETFRNPSWANSLYYWCWQLDANISDATPVNSSAMLTSIPILYRDIWSIGTPGWIHTSYDNSTSTETLSWVEPEDLEDHIKVSTLAILRISPSLYTVIISGPHFTWYSTEYWIIKIRERSIRVISRYH